MPRWLRSKTSTQLAQDARKSYISSLPCDNASSGVIAPRCVYIEGISMASKEFEIAARSRYLIYCGLSGRTKTRSAPILICNPGGRCCRLRHNGELSFFPNSLESCRERTAIRMSDMSDYRKLLFFLSIFPNDV